MADLVTHLASVLLPGVFVRHRALPLVGVGAVLPDAISRVPGEGLGRLRAWGFPIPDGALQPWGILHQPVPLACACGLLALAFRDGQRREVFAALGLGSLAHVALDLLQDHHGHGYPVLYPLSTQTFELGLLHSEATVAWAPWLGLLTALVWGVRLVQDQRSKRPSGNTPPAAPGPRP